MSHKIALLSEHASPLATIGGIDAGGQNIAVAELALHLAKLGHQVDVFTRWYDASQPQVIEWQTGVRVIHIQAGPVASIPKEELMPHMDEFAQRMIHFFKQQTRPYSLVHAHFFMSGYVACQIKQQLEIPFVVTFHALGKVRKRYQADSDRFPEDRDAIEQCVIQQANATIALCPQDREDLIQLYQVTPAQITLIPNGFNHQQFYPVDKALARLLIGCETTEPILLQLGRLVPRKGVDNVVQSLATLHREYGIRARLLIVGGDSTQPDPTLTPEIGRLMELARQIGVEQWVTFTGSRNRDDLRYYYSAADVFVTTPWYEPFGITPLEAMACGTPVVGSAVGGIKHTVLDNETGFLVPPNQPKALAAKLAALLFNRKLRLLLGNQAVSHVQANYTWQRVAELTAVLYEQILAWALPTTYPSTLSPIATLKPAATSRTVAIKE
ncbi:glycosyltransferase [Spirosoma sp.]|uniref:glycosyltransferase n=1 Tax=Spirosoma sp. TaxID=1899569 RepID=UPI003B3B6D5F